MLSTGIFYAKLCIIYSENAHVSTACVGFAPIMAWLIAVWCNVCMQGLVLQAYPEVTGSAASMSSIHITIAEDHLIDGFCYFHGHSPPSIDLGQPTKNRRS
jgi:hypothetical protein